MAERRARITLDLPPDVSREMAAEAVSVAMDFAVGYPDRHPGLRNMVVYVDASGCQWVAYWTRARAVVARHVATVAA